MIRKPGEGGERKEGEDGEGENGEEGIGDERSIKRNVWKRERDNDEDNKIEREERWRIVRVYIKIWKKSGGS